MFGMSFGNSAPQETRRDELANNEEVAEVLKDFDLIASEQSLTSEDYSAIKARADVIKKETPHVHEDAVIVLAYVDRMINVQREAGNVQAADALVAKVTTDLIASLVKEQHVSDEEFLKTILNAGIQKYNSVPGMNFSDALLDEIEHREYQLESTPSVSGKIDAQGNVAQATDEQFK